MCIEELSPPSPPFSPPPGDFQHKSGANLGKAKSDPIFLLSLSVLTVEGSVIEIRSFSFFPLSIQREELVVKYRYSPPVLGFGASM